MIRGLCCILLAVAIFVPIARKIYKWNCVSDAQRAAAQQGLVDRTSSLPEPAERSAYVLGCLLAPVLIFGLTFAARRLEQRIWSPPQSFQLGSQLAVLIALVGYAWWLLAGDGFFPVGLNVVYCYPLAIIPLLLFRLPLSIWLGGESAAQRWLRRVAVGVPLLAMVLAGWMGANDDYVLKNIHFTAAYDPVAQVSMGKNLLVEYGSQYGLYPDFLAPLFAVIGLSVGKFTFVMAMLTASGFGMLWLVLRQAISRRSVAILGFIALTFNGWLMFQIRSLNLHPEFFDPYFQYMPLRFIFPAIAIAVTWFYHQSHSRRLYWIAQLALGCGVLWNLDSGIVALGGWLAALVFEALYESTWPLRARRIAEHIAATILATAGVVVSYSLVKFSCYGVWPDLGHMFDYQRLFYLSGFNMLPMHFRGAWQLVVLAYLAGLAYSAAALFAGDRGPRQTLVLMLSVLGLGLFSYFQGRSHEMCLILCWWPALVLVPIFVNLLLDLRRQETNLLGLGLAVVLGMFLIGSAASFLTQSPTLCRATVTQLARLVTPGSPFSEEGQLLREHVAPGDGVLVLSGRAPLLETEARISSLAPASLVQMLWVSQYESLLQSLEQHRRSWIFIDGEYSKQFFVRPQDNSGSQMLMAAITPRLRKIADTERGSLYEFFGAHGADPTIAARRPIESTSDEPAEDRFQILTAAFPFVRGMPR